MPKVINSFRGEYSFLSNFYTLPSVIKDDMGIEYTTVEHYFQAAKSDDFVTRLRVANEETPSAAKKAGGKRGYVTIRPDWDSVKDSIMFNAVLKKFSCSLRLRDLLLETGSAILVEGNTWGDTYWGVCDGQGKNVLGYILMAVRYKLQKEQEI